MLHFCSSTACSAPEKRNAFFTEIHLTGAQWDDAVGLAHSGSVPHSPVQSSLEEPTQWLLPGYGMYGDAMAQGLPLPHCIQALQAPSTKEERNRKEHGHRGDYEGGHSLLSCRRKGQWQWKGIRCRADGSLSSVGDKRACFSFNVSVQ